MMEQKQPPSLEERLAVARSARESTIVRFHAINGQIALLEQLITEKANAEKKVQADPPDGGDQDTQGALDSD